LIKANPVLKGGNHGKIRLIKDNNNPTKIINNKELKHHFNGK